MAGFCADSHLASDKGKATTKFEKKFWRSLIRAVSSSFSCMLGSSGR
ncbi:hypothetical protein [Rubritalea tangerina]